MNQEVRLIEPEFKLKKNKKQKTLNNLTTKQEAEREAKRYENRFRKLQNTQRKWTIKLFIWRRQ